MVLYTVKMENGTRIIKFVTVRKFEERTSKNGKNQILLHYEDDGKQATAFLTDSAPGKGVATTFKKMKVREGSQILLNLRHSEGYESENCDNLAYHKGVMNFQSNNKTMYAIVSYCTNPHPFGNGNYSVSIPVKARNAETGIYDDQWYQVNFIGEKSANHAKEVLNNASSIAVIAESLTDKTSADGKVYHNLIGREIYKLTEKEA